MLARALRNRVFGLVDAIEIRNGRGTEKENLFAEKVAERLDMPTTGASDAHKLADLGTFATRFYDKVTGLESLINAIKSGRFRSCDISKLASDEKDNR
jgi:hypothetical protein